MDIALPIANLPLFIPAAIALILAPGPVVLYIINRSVNQGRKAGLVSVAGGVLGNLCHVMAAAFGLSAVLLSSSLAFDVLKYLGAAYLIYLGIQKLRSSDEIEEQAIQPKTLQNIFIESIIVAILNPKTALFFFAFLPQFIEPAKGFVTGQILFLGVLLVTMSTIGNAMFAVMGGAAGRWLRGNARYLRVQRYVSGTVYIGLGLTAALASGKK